MASLNKPFQHPFLTLLESKHISKGAEARHHCECSASNSTLCPLKLVQSRQNILHELNFLFPFEGFKEAKKHLKHLPPGPQKTFKKIKKKRSRIATQQLVRAPERVDVKEREKIEPNMACGKSSLGFYGGSDPSAQATIDAVPSLPRFQCPTPRWRLSPSPPSINRCSKPIAEHV